MDIRPIRTEADHRWALGELEPYFHCPPDAESQAGDRFEVLMTLVEAYEAKQWTAPEVDPIAILQAAMEDIEPSRPELAAVLGSPEQASAILARKQPLSPEMIRRISEAWAIPAALLLPIYALNDVA